MGDNEAWYRFMPSQDEYFLGIAKAISAGADCRRRQVGAVIVNDQDIVGYGFNIAPDNNGQRPSCLAGECPRGLSDVEPGSAYDDIASPGFCFALHAEEWALLQAGTQARGAVLYCTEIPCRRCHRLIVGSGIVRVVT